MRRVNAQCPNLQQTAQTIGTYYVALIEHGVPPEHAGPLARDLQHRLIGQEAPADTPGSMLPPGALGAGAPDQRAGGSAQA